MYLKTLQICNFRGLKKASVHWHKGVNVLVGENNTGKTAILDALRLCLAFGDNQRDIWVHREDYHVSSAGQISDSIEFHLIWSDLTEEEKGVYIDMLVLPETGKAELQFHVQYEYDHEKDRTKRPTYWGGEKEGQPISPEILDLLEHVYLGALRDATRDLAPRRGNQLSRLFHKLATKQKGQEELAKEINEQVRGMPLWRRFLRLGKKRINEHLTEISFQDAHQEVDIDFVESQFRQIVEGLRLQVPGPAAPGSDPSYFNIWQNGLGYNNLIYMATVFGDLLKRRARYSYASLSLLIEEPEAHLHPQLQDVLFRYLGKIASQDIQVFLSSHSPIITAKTNVDSLIVLSFNDGVVTSTPISSIELDKEHKQLLQRFLDVTKCQLFFAKSVILVEGISEALLLPCLTRAVGLEFDLDKCGVEVVNICGVAFEPFARLFSSESREKRLGARGVIVTDDDAEYTTEGNGGNISSRAECAKSLADGLLKVVLARHTFEYELFISNEVLVTSTYKKMHPQTNLDFEGTPEQKAEKFAKKIHVNQDKAAFAQTLAAKLEQDKSLSVVVPAYIEKAIRWAVKGEWEDADTSRSH